MSSKALKGGNKRESNMKLSGSTREVAVKGLEGRGDVYHLEFVDCK